MSYDPNFTAIYQKFTAPWEGGKCVDPRDPGGATAYGVSFRFLKGLPLKVADINRDGLVTWKDVMALDPAAAERLIHDYFWEESKVGQLPKALSGVMFDTAVNCGRSRSVKWLQYLLGLTPDGIIGTKQTLPAAHALSVPGLTAVASGLLARRRAHYGDLAARTEWARAFYGGWIARTAALETLVLGTPWVGRKAA